MKTAFATWNKRIAPVFDVARHVTIVETATGHITHQAEAALPNDLPQDKVARLAELGVGTLVCGAISQALQAMVAAHGIQVIPFVAGDVADVVQAWLAGRLTLPDFAMPGCGGRGRRRLHVRRGVCGGGRGALGGHGWARRGPGTWQPGGRTGSRRRTD